MDEGGDYVNEAAVKEIREQTSSLLKEAPRSRDTLERRFRIEQRDAEDIAAVLDEIDWTEQAIAVAELMGTSTSPNPAWLRMRLVVDGFTKAEVEAAFRHYDWQELMQIPLKDLMEQGATEDAIREALFELGYEIADIRAVLASFDEQFWEKQALRALNLWADRWESRQRFSPKGDLERLGFTPTQVEFALANLETDAREIARREAQKMHDEGNIDEGIAIALEYAGFTPEICDYAIDSIERSPRSVHDRRLECYLSGNHVLSEEGLRQRLGNLSAAEREALYTRHGIREIDWAELNRGAILEVVEQSFESRAQTTELLQDLGFDQAHIRRALEQVDWGEKAAAEAQLLIDEGDVFHPDELTGRMRYSDYASDEIEEAMRRVHWPQDWPEDVVVAKLRSLYMQQVPRDEAVERTVLAYNVPRQEVAETAASLGLDWAGQFRKLVDDYLDAHPDATPTDLDDYLAARVNLPIGFEEDYDKYDWSDRATRFVASLREKNIPDLLILQELGAAGFNHDTITKAAAATGLSTIFSVDTVAGHLRNLLDSTIFSQWAIEHELRQLGFTWELIREAEAQLGLDFEQIDWQRRALEWIRSQGEKQGLSMKEMRAELLANGYQKNEVAWAMGKSRTDYATNAVTRARLLLREGVPVADLPRLLRAFGFRAAEITRAVNEAGS